MTDITTCTACADSSRNRLLQDLIIAVARADASRIAELVADDVRWSPVGRKPVSGADAFCRAVTRYGPSTVLTIEHVASDARTGAVNGEVAFGWKRRAFCYVVEFGGAKGSPVRAITSYSVALD